MPENMLNTILAQDFATEVDLRLPEHTVNQMLEKFLPAKPLKDVEVLFSLGYFEIKGKLTSLVVPIPVHVTLELVEISLDSEHCWIDVKEHYSSMTALSKLLGNIGSHVNDMISVQADRIRLDLTPQLMKFKAKANFDLELLFKNVLLKPIRFEPGFMIIKVIKGLEFL